MKSQQSNIMQKDSKEQRKTMMNINRIKSQINFTMLENLKIKNPLNKDTTLKSFIKSLEGISTVTLAQIKEAIPENLIKEEIKILAIYHYIVLSSALRLRYRLDGISQDEDFKAYFSKLDNDFLEKIIEAFYGEDETEDEGEDGIIRKLLVIDFFSFFYYFNKVKTGELGNKIIDKLKERTGELIKNEKNLIKKSKICAFFAKFVYSVYAKGGSIADSMRNPQKTEPNLGADIFGQELQTLIEEINTQFNSIKKVEFLKQPFFKFSIKTSNMYSSPIQTLTLSSIIKPIESEESPSEEELILTYFLLFFNYFFDIIFFSGFGIGDIFIDKEDFVFLFSRFLSLNSRGIQTLETLKSMGNQKENFYPIKLTEGSDEEEIINVIKEAKGSPTVISLIKFFYYTKSKYDNNVDFYRPTESLNFYLSYLAAVKQDEECDTFSFANYVLSELTNGREILRDGEVGERVMRDLRKKEGIEKFKKSLAHLVLSENYKVKVNSDPEMSQDHVVSIFPTSKILNIKIVNLFGCNFFEIIKRGEQLETRFTQKSELYEIYNENLEEIQGKLDNKIPEFFNYRSNNGHQVFEFDKKKYFDSPFVIQKGRIISLNKSEGEVYYKDILEFEGENQRFSLFFSCKKETHNISGNTQIRPTSKNTHLLIIENKTRKKILKAKNKTPKIKLNTNTALASLNLVSDIEFNKAEMTTQNGKSIPILVNITDYVGSGAYLSIYSAKSRSILNSIKLNMDYNYDNFHDKISGIFKCCGHKPITICQNYILVIANLFFEVYEFYFNPEEKRADIRPIFKFPTDNIRMMFNSGSCGNSSHKIKKLGEDYIGFVSLGIDNYPFPKASCHQGKHGIYGVLVNVKEKEIKIGKGFFDFLIEAEDGGFPDFFSYVEDFLFDDIENAFVIAVRSRDSERGKGAIVKLKF